MTSADSTAPKLFEDLAWSWHRAEIDAFDFGDDLSTVEWAEKFIRLPPSITAFDGPWRSNVTPYVREPMNLWDLDHVRKTVKCWAPQTAKTTSTVLALLRKLSRGLGPALMVMSSETGLRRKFREEYIPLLKHSPKLRRMLSTAREDMTSSTIRLHGDKARLDGAWATSLPGLKSFGYRYCLGDEVEDWPANVGGGGDPEALLDVRTRTYQRTCHTELISSPGKQGGIWAKMLACEVVWVLLAKCPQCGAEQRMVWPGKDSPFFPRWKFDPEQDPQRIEAEHAARYLCAQEGCGAEWTDGDRDRAVRKGHWRAVDKKWFEAEHWDHPFPQAPGFEPLRPASIGSHLPSWYSPLVSLSKVVSDFLQAHREPDPVKRVEKLKTWTNNHPAHPWIDEVPASIAEDRILALKDDRAEGVVPVEALCVLLTADVQEDGVWYEVRAWGEGRKSWGVKHGFLPRIGAVAGEPLPGWEHVSPDLRQLGALAGADYVDAAGECLAVRFGLVDSGYRTDEVYEFCRLLRMQLTPSKGTPGKRTPVSYHKIDVYPGQNGKLIPGGIILTSYDDDVWKDRLSGFLAPPENAPPLWKLHADTGADYAAHYQAEHRTPEGAWKLRGSRANHLWDCGMLQCLAQDILEKNGTLAKLTAERHGEISSQENPIARQPSTTRSSLW